MKKVMIVALFLILIMSGAAFADDLNLTGESAILVDMDTGQVLYEKNPHLRLHPASTTKIMTGILAIEHGNFNDLVTVDDETPYQIKGSHIALEPGEQLLFKDLLYALLIESANDSALAIAKHIAGSAEEFGKMMNEKARELGAKDTNFVNPHGLTDENHLTTAYDLSLMARYAMENETFRNIVSNYSYTIPATNKKDESRYLKSANKLLYSSESINVDGKIVPIKYEGVTGVKTGYTTEAGNCLVASAEKGNRRLLAVVMKSYGNEVFADIHKLFNYGFGSFKNVVIANENEFIQNFQIRNGKVPVVAGIIKDSIICTVSEESVDSITQKVIVDDNLKAPVKEGQAIGKVEYYLEDKLIGSADIVSTMDIERDIAGAILRFLIDKWYIILALFIVGLKALSDAKQKRIRKYRRRATSLF